MDLQKSFYIRSNYSVLYTVGACHKDDNMRGELEAQLQLFDMAELVWSLCEILFIDTQPGIFSLLFDKTGGGGEPAADRQKWCASYEDNYQWLKVNTIACENTVNDLVRTISFCYKQSSLFCRWRDISAVIGMVEVAFRRRR